MWNGKNKAITFSFDDGVQQDKRCVEILNKYGLKGTFNLNSAKFGLEFPYTMPTDGRIIERTIITPEEAISLYKNHELGVHTLTHADLTKLPESCIVWQVEEDRKNLERLGGKPVQVMAYPCGYVDDRVVGVLDKKTKVKLARTVISTYNFEPQTDLLRFNPTIHMKEYDKMIELAKEFISLKTDTPKIFYIWGHTYEFDMDDINYQKFEDLCKLISGKEDIFYGTNGEVFFGK
ncbi:MAG: polysaccharide deacetylase family protein [Clostridia bacterium]|nr:polysaccharide deacetylase family protein [Clostridia bacterium]